MNKQERELRHLLTGQAAQWYVARKMDDWSVEQAREFMHWLRTSPLHVSEYLVVSGIADKIAEAACLDSTSLPDLLARCDAEKTVHWMNDEDASRAAGTACPHERSAPARARGSSRGVWRVAKWAAACTMLTTLSIAAAWLGLQDHGCNNAKQHYVSLHGERSQLPLPDGTVVALDTESEISVRYDAATRQIAVLRGQAFFDVAADSTRAFSVRAGNLLIRDIGTAFNVNREIDGTTIAVEHGKVDLYTNDTAARPATSRPEASIAAGYQAHVDAAGNAVVTKADLTQLTAWRRGEITFKNRRVVDVVSDFNRYNAAQIVVVDPGIAALRITGTFGVHDTASFIAFLETMPGVKTHTTNGGAKIIVQPGGKAQ